MSKTSCTCGHVIVDQSDALSFKAALLADEDAERFWGGISRGLAELLAAMREGRRDEWLSANFLPDYPRDVPDEGLFSDFLGRYEIGMMRTVYQCERCGRLLVESHGRTEQFESFVPEGTPRRNTLSSSGDAAE